MVKFDIISETGTERVRRREGLNLMSRIKVAINQVIESLEKTNNGNKVKHRNGKYRACVLALLIPASEAGVVDKL